MCLHAFFRCLGLCAQEPTIIMDPKSREKHQYPGELEYKTIIYKPIVSIEYLKKIEEEDLPFGKDAVFVISYPKSGQCERNNHDVT